ILGVADSADEASYVPAMEAADYILRIREPEWHEHHLFKGPDTDINLHVFTVGCAEIQRMLGFRDHLLTNAADRTAYEQRKQELAKQTWKYTQHYADAKSEVVEGILVGAGIAPVCVTH
ncbi:MAG: GrpB family protein, partial [Chloroflexota bacterium]